MMMNARRWAVLTLAAVAAVVLLLMSGSVIESVDANEVLVVQTPSGDLIVHTDPGIKMQWFGKATHYQKRDQFWFSDKEGQGADMETPIPVRFNDAGEASISGSVAWEMPLDPETILAIHSRYGTHASLEQQLVRTVVEKAVYMTGPLMSSRESYAERKNDLISLISDQIANGIYDTTTTQVQQVDPITGQTRTVSVVALAKDGAGNIVRQDESPLEEFHIRAFNLSINSVDYSDAVDKQIAEQQVLTQRVQTALAEAREAEQRKNTTEQQGAADAAKAKWEQEVIKAKEVTAAEQRKAVADLDVQTADARKREQILIGQGEAERKRLVMEADGALVQKLEAYKEVSYAYAGALREMDVPTVVFQGGDGGDVRSVDSGAALMRLLTAKTAKDLGLSLDIPGDTKER